MDVVEMRKDPREVRKYLKLFSGALYGKSVREAAKEAYLSGKTHAAHMTEFPAFIDGREDKSKPWTRI